MTRSLAVRACSYSSATAAPAAAVVGPTAAATVPSAVRRSATVRARSEKKAWLSIPVFARPEGDFTYAQRMQILDTA
ncbi:hypothetical protein QMZ92_34310 [Streptomyces sp. HNM0645]|uniref:hypothetical protein n=1 Tax=Streptomyces sp. HNM0645 TaxID=2782343 RepID=UPI0024B64BB7|nr:hypothetical protein [Streptomyces sp. HNM0645]MDI9889264.1 hypothetical protein [Streptomyces sp. HNM0645]